MAAMEYSFVRLGPQHRDGVLSIFNHYIRTSTFAYREECVADDYYGNFLEAVERYPGYAIEDGLGGVAGFCLLKAHKELSTFSEVAEIMYFLGPAHTGKGLGTTALAKLEADARPLGIRKILASISSENEASLGFHRARGFTEYGRFPDIGKKFGRRFGVVWMGKDLS
jgi:phosphinothricin acetyltransferase